MTRLLLATFLLLPAVLTAQDTTTCSQLAIDLDGDLQIGAGDILMLLGGYGTDLDVDGDMIPDCQDDCVGAYDICGVCNGPGPQVLAIDTIIITYDSIYAEAIDDWLIFELDRDTLLYLVCQNPGCMNPEATNFEVLATEDDGSCFYNDYLSGPNGKSWILDGEGSYYVGPCQGCNNWWGGIDAAGVIERACQMDDQWVFYDDGTMEYITDGVIWAEDYIGGNFECLDETLLAAPMDAFAAGTYAFTATDTEITVDGFGAFIGYNKVYNGGEHPTDGSGVPASSITYEVFEYTNVDGVEHLTITVDYGPNPGEAFWTFRLIAQ